MPWTVDFSPDDAVIRFRLTGTITFGDLEAALRRSVLLSREHGCWSYFVEAAEIIEHISILDLFYFPKLFPMLAIPFGAKVAVFRPQFSLEDPKVRFCETAFFNDFYQIKFFRKPEAALRWLWGDKARKIARQDLAELESGNPAQNAPSCLTPRCPTGGDGT